LRGVRRVAIEDVPQIINFDTGVLFLFLRARISASSRRAHTLAGGCVEVAAVDAVEIDAVRVVDAAERNRAIGSSKVVVAADALLTHRIRVAAVVAGKMTILQENVVEAIILILEIGEGSFERVHLNIEMVSGDDNEGDSGQGDDAEDDRKDDSNSR